MRKKLYAGLVTANPPREIAGKSVEASLQELSSMNATVQVPQGDTPQAKRERDLLLYDAALTPPDLPGCYGVPSWALDTVRMVRAAQMAERMGGLDQPGALTEDENKRLSEALDRYARSGVQYDAALTRFYAANGSQMATRTRCGETLAERDLSSWADAVNAARSIAAMARDEPPIEPPGGRGRGGEGEGEGDEDEGEQPARGNPSQGESQGASEDSKPVDDFKKVIAESMIPNKNTGERPKQLGRLQNSPDPWKQGNAPQLSAGESSWGELVNASKPDTLRMNRIAKRKKGDRNRADLTGVVPQAVHRYSIDGKIFKGAKVRGGSRGRGSVLVDMSGSMHWDRASFEALLDVLPECTVLGYSGQHCRTKGRLVLLADRGRMADLNAVEDWNRDKGLNVVDGPALLALAKMSKPRVWISDGRVTGRGEHRTQPLINQANAIMLANNIVRAETAKDAANILLGRKR